MFENPRRSRQERNFTTNGPKILDLKSSSELIFSRKLPLGAPVITVGILPYERLKGMCRWMGSHFHDWIDHNRVATTVFHYIVFLIFR